MRKLVVNDLVKANTGIGGGYKYKSNKKVTLYDVYVALNDEVEIFAFKKQIMYLKFLKVR